MTMPLRPRKALIVGGGIAGTVAAVALSKAGLEPVVFEAYGRSADGVGAFLTLASNGVRGLRTLGLDERALARGIATPRFDVALGDGRALAEIASASGDDGAVSRTIQR